MPTIQKFEDLEVWKKARILSDKVYPLTYQEPISNDFRIKDSSGGMLVQLWIILPKVLKEEASMNLLIHLQFPKVKPANLNPNFTDALITSIFLKKVLTNFIILQMK